MIALGGAVALCVAVISTRWLLVVPGNDKKLKQQQTPPRSSSESTSRMALLGVFGAVLGLAALAASQSGNQITPFPSSTASGASTVTSSSFAAQFTVPDSADQGQKIIANLQDPQAVDPQAACPGYTAGDVRQTANGFSARLQLAGAACNVYGNEVNFLDLTVEYQAADRLHVGIQPAFLGPANETWFVLPDELVTRPANGGGSAEGSDLAFEWTNDPSFAFTVRRKSTGDVLFTTNGTRLVFEDQFIEFKSTLPEGYNLYGLGEVIHGFRLNRNLNSKLPHGVFRGHLLRAKRGLGVWGQRPQERRPSTVCFLGALPPDPQSSLRSSTWWRAR